MVCNTFRQTLTPESIKKFLLKLPNTLLLKGITDEDTEYSVYFTPAKAKYLIVHQDFEHIEFDSEEELINEINRISSKNTISVLGITEGE